MKSKTLTLAATAIAAALAMSAMPAQAELPKLAGGPAAAAPAASQTLTHANGYSVTVPSDWVVATDIEGTDFMMGNADLSIICQTFSATGLDMQATDEMTSDFVTQKRRHHAAVDDARFRVADQMGGVRHFQKRRPFADLHQSQADAFGMRHALEDEAGLVEQRVGLVIHMSRLTDARPPRQRRERVTRASRSA